ncbi:MAG TPA: NAD(P)/FAD-dependent oxidoreductase [Puia sp.]|nr:NAD(P)/FAD-dependent oxidoreductase [Puia sp.]
MNFANNYDAVVVGSGPNGLAAAITMQRNGLAVLLLEAKPKIGGGVKTAESTLPGFLHDSCSCVYPLAVCSPFFESIPAKFQPEFIYASLAAAHPFDDGSSYSLEPSIIKTAAQFGEDERTYLDIFETVQAHWPNIVSDLLMKTWYPDHLRSLMKFGVEAILPASTFARKKFKNAKAQAFFAGMAAHSMLPLHKPMTSSVALMLMLAGHHRGWPIVKGGSANLASCLAAYFISLGGRIETSCEVRSVNELPPARAFLFDITPTQLLDIAGNRFSSFYKWQLRRFKYGSGIFKMDWALSEPVPFTAGACKSSATVHLGNSFDEIAAAEKRVWENKDPIRPFVLFVQPSLFDSSRAPEGKHTAWAYCHAPAYSTTSLCDMIEQQVERFAPGFRDCILGRHTVNTRELQNSNANYIGGDINGGVQDITQFFSRPVLRSSPYRTSGKGIYICSSSTPPGGGVHGVCGFKAARRVLKDIFHMVDRAQSEFTSA